MKLNMNIKWKIVMFFSICLFLIFGSLLLYINQVIKPRNINHTEFTISQIVESKSNEVGSWINKKAVEYRIISAIPAFTSMDVREITPLIGRFTDLYSQNGETMETFSYIGKNGFCWINSEATEELMNYHDYRQAYTGNGEFIIGNPIVNKNNREVILFYYPVLGYGGEKEALICSAVPTVGVKEIVNADTIYGGKTWVMGRDHQLITTDEDYFYSHYLSEQVLTELDVTDITSSGTMAVTNVDGQPCTLFYSPVYHYSPWLVFTLVENRALSETTNEMVAGCLLLFVLLLVITLWLGFFLTHSVMHPIRELQTCMNQVEEGNLKAYYDTASAKDEIYELGMSYNKMLDEITRLIDTIYQEQSEKRKAEFIALQTQIKPHFLYNTLDNLKWMAKDYGAEDIAAAITSLSTYFRIILSNGQEKISLRDELKHTRCYLDIQKMRYREKLSFSIEMEEAISDFITVKIIVQPLVENAIYHGIKPSTVNGHITIKAWQEDDSVYITVADNGVGMDRECLEALQKRLADMDSEEHFGMVNTLRRLKSAYGDKAEMKVESSLSTGTTVTIRIPVERGKSYVPGACS